MAPQRTDALPDDRPPVVVVDDPAALEHVAVAPGRRVRSGFGLPARPRDLADHGWVCRGVVASREDARAAVEALERGVGLIVAVAVEGRVRLALLEDLERAGRITPADGGHVLDDDQRRLLALLADGVTVAAAAQEAGVSRRTANRRLADARARLGVDTTVEAVVDRDRRSP
jgi:DNA-binding CsgD family transcriptional regulator